MADSVPPDAERATEQKLIDDIKSARSESRGVAATDSKAALVCIEPE